MQPCLLHLPIMAIMPLFMRAQACNQQWHRCHTLREQLCVHPTLPCGFLVYCSWLLCHQQYMPEWQNHALAPAAACIHAPVLLSCVSLYVKIHGGASDDVLCMCHVFIWWCSRITDHLTYVQMCSCRVCHVTVSTLLLLLLFQYTWQPPSP